MCQCSNHLFCSNLTIDRIRCPHRMHIRRTIDHRSSWRDLGRTFGSTDSCRPSPADSQCRPRTGHNCATRTSLDRLLIHVRSPTRRPSPSPSSCPTCPRCPARSCGTTCGTWRPSPTRCPSSYSIIPSHHRPPSRSLGSRRASRRRSSRTTPRPRRADRHRTSRCSLGSTNSSCRWS